MIIRKTNSRKNIIALALSISAATGAVQPLFAQSSQPTNTNNIKSPPGSIAAAPEPPATKQADAYAERLLASISQSQTVPHRLLTLQVCFNQADLSNKEIAVATSALTSAQAGIVIAKAIPNPTYSMAYGFGDAWKLIIAGNGQQFGFAEEIQVAGRRTKKAMVAGATYVQTAFRVEAVRFDVHNRVRRAYAELAAAHAYADLVEAQKEIARKLLDISQKRFDAGKAPGSEVLQAKLSFMQFDTQQMQAWGRLVQDSAQLALLLGEEPRGQEIIDVEENGLFELSLEKNALVPNPVHDIPALDQLLPVAFKERPDLRVAIQTAFANKKSITLAKTQRIPDPTVGFQYFFSTYTPYQFGFFDPAGVLPYLQTLYPNVPQLQTNYHNPNPSKSLVFNLYNQSIASGAAAKAGLTVPSIGQDKVPFQPGYQITVQEEMPIFYQYQGQIAQAKATWLQQLKQNDQLYAQIATDVVSAYESLIITRANIAKFRQQILPAASRVAQLTRRGYQMGKTDLATVILAQQQYQQLLSNYFDAVVAYQNVWADLEKAIGLPLNL